MPSPDPVLFQSFSTPRLLYARSLFSIDRSSLRPLLKLSRIIRSVVLQLSKYIIYFCDLYRSKLAEKFSKISSPRSLSSTLLARKFSSLSTGVNERNAQRRFLLYIYLTLESRPRQRDTKFFEPRAAIIFPPPKKKKEHSFRQVEYFELNYDPLENTFSTSKRIFFFRENFRQTFDQRRFRLSLKFPWFKIARTRLLK